MNVSEEITASFFRIEVCGSVSFTADEPEFLSSNTAMALYCTLHTLSSLFDNINIVLDRGFKINVLKKISGSKRRK